MTHGACSQYFLKNAAVPYSIGSIRGGDKPIRTQVARFLMQFEGSWRVGPREDRYSQWQASRGLTTDLRGGKK